MSAAFEAAVARVIAEETGGDANGGYTTDPRDPGGETRWGIAKASHPTVDIANLTREQAVAIYRAEFWDALRCDELPPRVAFAVFDTAVNSGIRFAARALQRCLRVQADGLIGPDTIAAARAVDDPASLLMRFYGARLMLLTDLAAWGTFGRGWSRRVARDLLEG